MAYTKTISIPTARGQVLVDLQQIIRIESISNYSRIYFSNGNYPLTVARALCRFEEILPAEHFIRIHRTHLVNKNFILEINLGKKPSLSLINGEIITISRRKKGVTHKLVAA